MGECIFLSEMRITPRHLRYINFFTASGISTAYIFGKTLNAKNFKAELEAKTDDNKVLPVPPNLKHLVSEVLSDMKLDPKEKVKIEPFMCKSNEMRHVGFSVLGLGAYLGLPQNFLLDPNNLMNFSAEVDGKEIPKNAPEFQDLKRVMCLSDNAKKFAVAQEIYLSQHKDIIPCGVLPLLIVINFNLLSFALDKISIVTQKVHPPRFHYFIFFMGAWLYAIVYDILSVFADADSVFYASKLGESYVLGGIEYYTKMIQRNKIFKSMNKNAPYTENGDKFISYFRTTHMPLPRRLVYLDNIRNGKIESAWNYVFYAG